MGANPRRERDIYIALMNAAANGRGLNLTTREVWDLAGDDAIVSAAINGLAESETADSYHVGFWSRIDPYKDRIAAQSYANGSA